MGRVLDNWVPEMLRDLHHVGGGTDAFPPPRGNYRYRHHPNEGITPTAPEQIIAFPLPSPIPSPSLALYKYDLRPGHAA